MTDLKKPSKPKPTPASLDQLIAHYNSQLPAYNAKVLELPAARHAELLMEPVEAPCDFPEKAELVKLIRRQNHRLGRHIKARATELLLSKLTGPNGERLEDDGYTLGLTYQDVLVTLAEEFPEASTSVACLRWYVVHMRSDARDEGKPWPDLPQKRKRSSAPKPATTEE